MPPLIQLSQASLEEKTICFCLTKMNQITLFAIVAKPPKILHSFDGVTGSGHVLIPVSLALNI